MESCSGQHSYPKIALVVLKEQPVARRSNSKETKYIDVRYSLVLQLVKDRSVALFPIWTTKMRAIFLAKLFLPKELSHAVNITALFENNREKNSN